MRGGDIFMGAFNAEQVMYNHFGYRTPIAQSLHGGLGRAIRAARSPAARAISAPGSSRATSASSRGGSRGTRGAALGAVPQQAA